MKIKIIDALIIVAFCVFVGGLCYDMTHPPVLTPAQIEHLKSLDNNEQKK